MTSHDPTHDGPDQATPTDAAPPDLSYEQARAELLEVVRTLEQGGATLEESIALWERGEALAETCQRWLDGARERLEEVVAARGDH